MWGQWRTPWGQERYREEVAAVEKEVTELEKFFGVDVDAYEVVPTYGVPCFGYDEEGVDGDYVVAVNPVVQHGAKHEARHLVHQYVLDEVVGQNLEDSVQFYEEELYGLKPDYGMLGMLSRLQAFSGPSPDALYEDVKGEDGFHTYLPRIMMVKNNRTDIQSEAFANNSTRKDLIHNGAAAAVLSGSAVKHGAATTDITEVAAASPEATLLAGGFGVMAAGAVDDFRKTIETQPLTAETLKSYGEADRRRAMLYNSRITDTVPEFLDLLDEYGIDG